MTEIHQWSRPFAVVNPLSAAGRTERKWPRIRSGIESHIGRIDYKITSRPNEAADIVREALADGYDYIISVGGDGFNNDQSTTSAWCRMPVEQGLNEHLIRSAVEPKMRIQSLFGLASLR